MLVPAGRCVSCRGSGCREFIDQLLDPRFYGINLNQNVVLEEIGYAGSTGTPWEKLFKISTGNIIITVLGFVPGMHCDPCYQHGF